jgi:hypothetical protein
MNLKKIKRADQILPEVYGTTLIKSECTITRSKAINRYKMTKPMKNKPHEPVSFTC